MGLPPSEEWTEEEEELPEEWTEEEKEAMDEGRKTYGRSVMLLCAQIMRRLTGRTLMDVASFIVRGPNRGPNPGPNPGNYVWTTEEWTTEEKDVLEEGRQTHLDNFELLCATIAGRLSGRTTRDVALYMQNGAHQAANA